jgi:hypothetical protein
VFADFLRKTHKQQSGVTYYFYLFYQTYLKESFMKKSLFISIAVTALFSLMFSGCQKAPEVELATAKAAIDSARIAGADKYLPSDFSAAQDSLKVAIAEIEKQKSANPITVNYTKAVTLLTSTTQTARELTKQAVTINQKLLSDIDVSLLKADSLVTETKGLFANVQKSKNNKSLLDTIGNNLSAVELSLAEIPKIKTEGNLTDAQNKITSALETLDTIKVKLTPVSVVKAAKK